MSDNSLFKKHFECFFMLYNCYIEIDKYVSLTEYGRDRSIIYAFFWYFKELTKKELNEIELKKKRNNLIKMLNNYKKRFNYNLKEIKYNCQICFIDSDLLTAFRLFFNAATLYRNYRSKLKKDQLKKIIIRVISDYIKGAVDNNNVNLECLESLNFRYLRNTTNLKQALMEFNNAISHLNKISLNIEKEINKKRAINHLQRGTLDYYKSIIKELFLLHIITEKAVSEIYKIREEEYNHIGLPKNDIIKKYHKILKDIIGKI